MTQFYKAEAKAFKSAVVVNAFESVGLCPWNPETIFKGSREEVVVEHANVRNTKKSWITVPERVAKACDEALKEFEAMKRASPATQEQGPKAKRRNAGTTEEQ